MSVACMTILGSSWYDNVPDNPSLKKSQTGLCRYAGHLFSSIRTFFPDLGTPSRDFRFSFVGDGWFFDFFDSLLSVSYQGLYDPYSSQ